MIEIGKSAAGIVKIDINNLVETRLLIQGVSGSGKSHTMRRLIEQSHGKIQQIIIDPDGEFSTLREKYDFIIAGKDGDAPANPKTAKLLARRLLELGVSAICDLYELKYHDRIQFVRYFLESIMNVPRDLWHPVLIFVDEAHIFCPEKGQAESFAAMIDLCSRGRKREYCAIFATQRLSKIHKDACAELLNKMIGKTCLDIDQARAADELGITGKQERRELRNLDRGEFYAYGPSVRISEKPTNGIVLTKIGGVNTSPPKSGLKAIKGLPKPTAKIREALSKLADLPADIDKQERDIKFAEIEISNLKRELMQSRKGNQVAAPCNHEPILKELKSSIQFLKADISAANKTLDIIGKLSDDRLHRLQEDITGAITVYRESPKAIPIVPISTAVVTQRRPANNPKPAFEKAAPGDNSNEISKGQIRILNALASMELLGMESGDKASVAAHSRYRPGSGGYNNLLGSLRSAGMIDYPQPGLVQLTDMGRSIATPTSGIASLSDIHDAWRAIIKSQSQIDILNHLIDIYPGDTDKEALALAIEKSFGSGGYNNNLGKLRTLGAILYPSKGRVKAADILFPKGLR